MLSEQPGFPCCHALKSNGMSKDFFNWKSLPGDLLQKTRVGIFFGGDVLKIGSINILNKSRAYHHGVLVKGLAIYANRNESNVDKD